MSGSRRQPFELDGYDLLRHVARSEVFDVYLASSALAPGKGFLAKVLRPALRTSPLVERTLAAFSRQLAQVDVAGLVPVRDVQSSAAGTCVVEEFFPGLPLSELTRRLGELSLAFIVSVGIEVCSVLTSARLDGAGASLHAEHGSLSPGDVYVGLDGSVAITDLGLDRALWAEDTVVTRAALAPKLVFAPPEASFETERVDERSDVYAVGALLYALAAGRPPFVGADLTSLLVARATHRPPALRTLRDCPDRLSELIARTLSRRPSDRLPSAAALGTALAELGRSLGMSLGQQARVMAVAPALPEGAWRAAGQIALASQLLPRAPQWDARALARWRELEPELQALGHLHAGAWLSELGPAERLPAPSLVGRGQRIARALGAAVSAGPCEGWLVASTTSAVRACRPEADPDSDPDELLVGVSGPVPSPLRALLTSTLDAGDPG